MDDIFDYIAHDSPVAAERFVTAILAGLYDLAELGLTGAPRDWIRPGLRLHVHGKYCAYFRYDADSITVIRIVHGARDIDAIFYADE